LMSVMQTSGLFVLAEIVVVVVVLSSVVRTEPVVLPK